LQKIEKLKKPVELIYSNIEKTTRERRIFDFAVRAQDGIMPLTEPLYDSLLVLNRRPPMPRPNRCPDK